MNVRPGLTGLLAFLTYLDDQNIMCDLMHTSPSDINVYFTLVGKRVEVRFEENEVDWCCFTGDESMETDFSELEALIKAHISTRERASHKQNPGSQCPKSRNHSWSAAISRIWLC
jgi:hypothetical protein